MKINLFFFLTTTQAKRINYFAAINVESKFPTDVQAILSISDDFLLTACSSSTRIPSLQLVDIKTGNFAKVELTKSASMFEPEPKVTIIPTELPADELMPPSIYIEPVREGKVPLIVIPHGGPHGVLSNSFDHDTAYFTRLGKLCFVLNVSILHMPNLFKRIYIAYNQRNSKLGLEIKSYLAVLQK